MNLKNVYVQIILILLILTPIWIYLRKNQNQKSNKIDTIGNTTIGTVWKRGSGSTNHVKSYNIHFDFKKGDDVLSGYINTMDETIYEKAIIGMKYEVKYLKKDNIRFGDSKIYINKPIKTEYQNIESERNRIRKIYGQGEGIFKKKWRPLNEIDSTFSN